MQKKTNTFGARTAFQTPAGSAYFYQLAKLEEQGLGKISRLPFSIKVLLESLLRNCDGFVVREQDVANLAKWDAKASSQVEIPFKPARVVLQDFTGVPALVDLAAMRSAMQRLGGDPKKIEPLIPADLVVDHSVQVDRFASADALARNMEIVVVDAQRGFGNGQLLPAGPLRAPLQRLDGVDLLVSNGGSGHGAYAMRLQPDRLKRFRDGVEINLGWLRGRSVTAIAGIGNPARFFNLLEGMGAQLEATIALPDHADAERLRASMLDCGPVIMTEKDAAKLTPSVEEAEIYVLAVQAQLPTEFWQAFDEILKRITEDG